MMIKDADKSIFSRVKVLGSCGVATILLLLCTGFHANEARAQTGNPVMENERVKVWDIKLETGKPVTLSSPDMDSVTEFLEGGKIRTTAGNGKTSVATRKFGDALFNVKGSSEKLELLSGPAAHLFFVELKNTPAKVWPNNTGYSLSFPRPGSTKVLENNRVIIWNYDYKSGHPTPMHYHDKDALVAYRYDAVVSSTTPDGQRTDNQDVAGALRFTKGNRSHVEALEKGQESVIVIEFKS